MINRVVLVGRLTKNPDLRYTPSGVAVCNFTLACNRPFKNDQGEQQADFINCVVWRKPAENVANYLSKGSLCGVDGRLQSRSYEGQDGKMVYITEVVADSVQFLDTKNSNQQNSQNNANTGNYGQGNTNTPNQSQSPQNSQANNNQSPFQGDGAPIDISDDSLPF